MRKGVLAKNHAIIYTDKPVMFDGEKENGLTKTPIRVAPSTSRNKLDKASRLNYAKLYTVEYNVKVCFIGKIHEDSEYQLTADYNKVHPLMLSPRYTASYSEPAPTVSYRDPAYHLVEYSLPNAYELSTSSSAYPASGSEYQQSYKSEPGADTLSIAQAETRKRAETLLNARESAQDKKDESQFYDGGDDTSGRYERSESGTSNPIEPAEALHMSSQGVAMTPLHEAYRRVDKPRRYFTEGKVFLTPWIEPAGPSATDQNHISSAPFDLKGFTEIRRFVVVRNQPGFCLAVPIHTYRGRGKSKRWGGSEANRCLVFKVAKEEFWDHLRLEKNEFPIVVEDPEIQIDDHNSHIIFGKTYTIEDYAKVRTIGFIHKDAMARFEECFRQSLGIDSGDSYG